MRTNQSRSTIFLTALTSGAGTLMVALVIGWLTMGRLAVGREEVIELIDARTPQIAGQQTLRDAVERNTARIDELTIATRDLEKQSHRVEAKLDLLLNEFQN